MNCPRQNIQFPDAATLEEDNPALLGYADAVVDTGGEAEAYATYIDGHLAVTADGATYADLGGPEREARAALEAAQAEGADDATVAELQAAFDEVSGQRNSLFKGETLRGLLLSTFAWSTIGRIAGIAAIAAFVDGRSDAGARHPRSLAPRPHRTEPRAVTAHRASPPPGVPATEEPRGRRLRPRGSVRSGIH